MTRFLGARDGRKTWALPDGVWSGFAADGYFVGPGGTPFEVAVATTSSKPGASNVRSLWKQRKGNQASPLLLVVVHGDRVAVCGPSGDDPSVLFDLPIGQVERVATHALDAPNKVVATSFVLDALGQLETELPGLRNVGMFASHQLRHGVPDRSDWATMTAWGKRLLGLSGEDLITGLGFKIENLGVNTRVLRLKEQDTKVAVAIFLDETEMFDAASLRFDGFSPVTSALAKADVENLPYVVLVRGSKIRVHAARKHTGVGRKGRAETFVEADLALLPDADAGFLPLLFGAEALRPEGTFEKILEDSLQYGLHLGERLRDRVYDEVVPALAGAVAGRYIGAVTTADLDDLYETTLVILFRLLFIAYAEDRDLLPLRVNGNYQRVALKTLARELSDRSNAGSVEFDPEATSLWDQAVGLWKAIDKGNRDWGVPPYDGGMFSSDPAVSPVGARIEALSLPNAEFGPVLLALLVDRTAEGVFGPVDFRSLSVREFGTIYEGLLESSLSVASEDLMLAGDGVYVPLAKDGELAVASGQIYLHNRSGARKATGSYFTKPFAVEHLLDHALEPALDDHLARVATLAEAGDEHGAAEAFFDFRVADIAMGSGHFLVAAVDHIEARLSTFLAEHPIPGVMAELERLRTSARAALGADLSEVIPLEDSTLLRRQVARHCVYGVDINLIAVELARLAVWIHTFVAGLPLSFLDHNLVQGNSLTGIGTIDEAMEILEPDTGRAGTVSMWRAQILAPLEAAAKALERLGRLSDADAAEIKEAREAQADAARDAEPIRRLFDALVGHRLGEVVVLDDLGRVRDGVMDGTLEESIRMRIEEIASRLEPLHFPTAFPEVFLRNRAGFDCILGNPPWEEATVEELGFWTLRFRGLKSMNQADQQREVARLRRERPDLVAEFQSAVETAERTRRILVAGPYPGIGTGDPDLYKAFAWRFWQLVRAGGAIGVVLPRSALMAKGTVAWREAVIDGGCFADVTLLLNNKQWVFPDVHPQYTVGLVSLRKGAEHAGAVRLRGPYSSLVAFRSGTEAKPLEFPSDEFRAWSDTLAFPLFPSERSGQVFMKLRSHPRLDAPERERERERDVAGPPGHRAPRHQRQALPRVRPVRELDATNDKQHFEATASPDRWPVYKGASFNLWEPDTGARYGWARVPYILGVLQDKRLRASTRSNSAFAEMPRSWVEDVDTLPCLFPRIAFRDVTNRTNQRTVIASLVPPRVVITNQAPYLLWIEGDERDEAYLLGVLSSIPLDWYARRMVETHVNFHIFNSFPIPRPGRDHTLRRRVEEIAGRLAAADDRYSDWAEAVGVPVGSVTDPDEKEDLLAELDAVVAMLYGLDEGDVIHIFETFHEGWDFQQRLKAVLRHFRRWYP